MKITEATSKILAYRRAARKLRADGFEKVELYRNYLDWPDVITDVVIGPDKTSLWWKKGKATDPHDSRSR